MTYTFAATLPGRQPDRNRVGDSVWGVPPSGDFGPSDPAGRIIMLVARRVVGTLLASMTTLELYGRAPTGAPVRFCTRHARRVRITRAVP